MGIFYSFFASGIVGHRAEMSSTTSSGDGKELSEEAKIRQQQDREYAASLAIDQKKRQAALDAQREERIAARDEKLKEEERNKRQARAESQLLPEPDSNLKPELVVTVQARTPGGEVLTRRFVRESPLLQVVMWVESLGYGIDRHRIFDSEHVEVCRLDLSKSFAEMGWTSREQISIVEK